MYLIYYQKADSHTMFDFLVQYCLALAKHLNNFDAILILQLLSAFLSYDNKHKQRKLEKVPKLYIYKEVIKQNQDKH